MQRKFHFFFVLAGIVMLMSHAPSRAEEVKTAPALNVPTEVGTYIIGSGDILDISVWKDETLTRSPIVLPDGFISFPLVGNIKAAGKTIAELKEEMEDKLVRYVPEVVLSMDVKQANSMIIYVIGRVNNPGRITLNSNVNVLQALATAGGLHIFAKRDKIKIFREENKKTKIFAFEYDNVVEGKSLEQNIRLKKGDVVVIP